MFHKERQNEEGVEVNMLPNDGVGDGLFRCQTIDTTDTISETNTDALSDEIDHYEGDEYHYTEDKRKQKLQAVSRRICSYSFCRLTAGALAVGVLIAFSLLLHNHLDSKGNTQEVAMSSASDAVTDPVRDIDNAPPTPQRRETPPPRAFPVNLTSAPVSTFAPTTLSPSTVNPTTLNPTTIAPTMPPPIPKTTFYAIGDIPYSDDDGSKLHQYMESIPADADFVVHLGDLRNADNRNRKCRRVDYQYASRLLQFSVAPVFVVLGDNDWMDCPNPDEAFEYWNEEFQHFASTHWALNGTKFQNFQRMPQRPETFSFVHAETLFLGLTIPDGKNSMNSNNKARSEWNARLEEQVEWTMELIDAYQGFLGEDRTGRVVIFGHADATRFHNRYFYTLTDYTRRQARSLPILYVNGDGHKWSYDPWYYNQESFLRIMVAGGKGSTQPPVQITIEATGEQSSTGDAFQVSRFSWMDDA